MTAVPPSGPQVFRSRARLVSAPCAFFVLAVVVVSALASTERWEPYPPGVGGPWGGSVRALVSPGDPANPSDPLWDVLWAATGGGVYRSADGGATWEPRNEGLHSLDVTDIDVCRNDPMKLIASTANRGIYLSNDGGTTWNRVDRLRTRANNAPQDRFWRVAVNPRNPSHLYAATFSSSDNLLESVDGGQTWNDRGLYPISRFRFSSPGQLFFATKTGRIFRVDAPGAVPVAVRVFPNSAEVTDLVLPGETGNILVAAQGGAGLWVGQGDGVAYTWAERHFQGSSNPDFHEVDAVGWDPAAADRIVYHLNDPLAGAATALYELPLGGTRTELPRPESGMELHGLFLTPAAEWILEAKAGLFRRLGRAGAFLHSCRGLAAYSARDVAFAPRSGGLAVAGGAPGSGNGGMYQWDPDGATWTRRASKPGDVEASSFPAASTLLVRYVGSDLWLGVEGYGLYRTADGGQTWQDRTFGLGTTAKREITGLEFSVIDPARAIAGTQAGVYTTSDAGANWVASPEIPPTIGWAVARDVADPAVFYAGGKQGNDGLFFRTGDTGTSWSEPAAGSFAGMQVRTLAGSPAVGGHVLAGAQLYGLFETFDGGASWTPLGGGESGLPGFGEVNAAAIAEGAGDAWMVAVINRHVYVTRDAGATWSLRDEGLALPDGVMNLIYALRFEPGTPRLVAAVDGRGLWYLDLFPWAELSGVPPALTASRSAMVQVGGSEIVGYRWSLDGATYSDEVPVGQAISLSGLADGAHRLKVIGRSSSGQWQPAEAATAAQWTVDATQPAGSVTINGGAAATPSVSVTLDQPATDGAGSGVTQMRVANGASPAAAEWVNYAATLEWVLPEGDGEKTVSAQFRDAAGNVSAVASDTILLDSAPPSGTVAINGGAAVATSASVTLDLAATDGAGSGVTQMRVANGASPAAAEWVNYAETLEWVLPEGDGEKTVSAQFRDAAGNVSAVASDTIVLDTTPPSVTAAPGAGTYTESQAVVLTANESATIYYTLDGSTPTTTSASGPSPVTVTVSQSATLRYFGVDAAGNDGAVASQAYVIQTLPPSDTTPPQVTVANPGGQYAGQVTVTLELNEAASIYYTLDGTEPTTQSDIYAGPLVIAESVVLKYIAVDTAGNASPVYTQTYTITPAGGGGGGGGGGGCFLSALGE